MLRINELALTQSQNQPVISAQSQLTIDINIALRKRIRSKFSFDKNFSSSKEVISFTQETMNVKGTLGVNNSGNYTFTLRITETGDMNTKKQPLEKHMKDVYVAVKHIPSRNIASRAQFSTVAGPDWGVTTTLDLGPEGDYEILIGNPAKPPAKP